MMMMLLLLCNITALLCNRLTKTCKLGSQHATLIWDIQVIVNWHLSKHFICWPVSHDYIAGSDLELIKIMFFFKWTTAATTRHCHTWITLETRDVYHILTMKSKEDGWAARKAQWEQSNSKKHRMIWHPKPSCKIQLPLHKSPSHPVLTLKETACQQSCFAFNIAYITFRHM